MGGAGKRRAGARSESALPCLEPVGRLTAGPPAPGRASQAKSCTRREGGKRASWQRVRERAGGGTGKNRFQLSLEETDFFFYVSCFCLPSNVPALLAGCVIFSPLILSFPTQDFRLDRL